MILVSTWLCRKGYSCADNSAAWRIQVQFSSRVPRNPPDSWRTRPEIPLSQWKLSLGMFCRSRQSRGGKDRGLRHLCGGAIDRVVSRWWREISPWPNWVSACLPFCPIHDRVVVISLETSQTGCCASGLKSMSKPFHGLPIYFSGHWMTL